MMAVILKFLHEDLRIGKKRKFTGFTKRKKLVTSPSLTKYDRMVKPVMSQKLNPSKLMKRKKLTKTRKLNLSFMRNPH